ncbi:hypothetical protein GY45DRAFT_803102 [Cubamyces sp. BRFM 1775]|nr:hypothetical protein GY45DRAFT_803102 [Cubamyces sp. BRFM 1775]
MSAPHAPSNPISRAMPWTGSSDHHDQQHTQATMSTPSFMSAFDTRKDESARRAISTILVFSAVVAAVPYLLVRGRMSKMDKKLASMHTTLAKEFKATRAHTDQRHQAAVDHTDAALGQIRKQLVDLSSATKGEVVQTRQQVASEVLRESSKLNEVLVTASRVGDSREGRRRAWEADMGRKMDILVNEEWVRSAQFAAEMRELGKSLADTAAFIEEVEMRQGWLPRPQDGRGIERMRGLATRLQKFATAAVRASPRTRVACVLTAMCSSRRKRTPWFCINLTPRVRTLRNPRYPTMLPVRRNRRPWRDLPTRRARRCGRGRTVSESSMDHMYRLVSIHIL